MMVGLRQAPETSSAVSCNDVHDVDYFLNEIVREVHGIGSKSKPLELLFVSWPQEHPRLLRDYEVHQVLATLGRGVQVTVIVDGCHAGHVLDRTRDHRFESIARGHVDYEKLRTWAESKRCLYRAFRPI